MDKKIKILVEIFIAGSLIKSSSCSCLQEPQDTSWSFPSYEGLISLNISNCNISDITQISLNSNLESLDLSSNYLTTVPSQFFPAIPNLLVLSLKNNPISTVGPHDFSILHRLQILDLSFCNISSVSVEFLGENHNIQSLHLEGNHITQLDSPEDFISKSTVVYLHDNPWACNCDLQSLRSWLPYLQGEKPLVCQAPARLQGLPVHSLDSQDLACLPVISPTYLYLNVKEFKDVSFMCRVKSNPVSEVSWIFNGSVLEGKGRMKITTISEGLRGERSELFIRNISVVENGTYHCSAENKAGRVASQFVLNVVRDINHNIVVEVGEEQLVYLVILLVMVLVLVLVILIILLWMVTMLCQYNEIDDISAKDIEEDILEHFLKISPDIIAQVSTSQSSDTTYTSIETDFSDSGSDVTANMNSCRAHVVPYPTIDEDNHIPPLLCETRDPHFNTFSVRAYSGPGHGASTGHFTSNAKNQLGHSGHTNIPTVR